MKTNYCLAAATPSDNTEKVKIMHLCFYENQPGDNDVDSLIEELRSDETFKMTKMVHDVDYFIFQPDGNLFETIKKELNIPDDL